MVCDGCGFKWFDTLITVTTFSVWLRVLGFLVGMKFSDGLMISAGEVFKPDKVGLIVFFLYRNWTQFKLKHIAKLMLGTEPDLGVRGATILLAVCGSSGL